MLEEKITLEQARDDVLIMADRLACLYYFMVESILEDVD